MQSTLAMRPYYLKNDYIKGNAFDGTLMSKSNHRLLLLPEELIIGLHEAIEYEAGQAMPVITYTCGRSWGERLVKRWEQEWDFFYQTELKAASFVYFEQWLKQSFLFHGWGEIELDFSLQDEGLLQFWLEDSVLAHLLKSLDAPRSCGIFSGLLAALTSGICERELEAVELECSKSGAERCHFVVAVPSLIEQARKMQLDGDSPQDIMRALRVV